MVTLVAVATVDPLSETVVPGFSTLPQSMPAAPPVVISSVRPAVVGASRELIATSMRPVSVLVSALPLAGSHLVAYGLYNFVLGVIGALLEMDKQQRLENL